MIDLNELKRKMYACAKKRSEVGGLPRISPHNMLKHCAGEVVEAMDAWNDYVWCDGGSGEIEERKLEYAMELGDVISCALILAQAANVDIEDILRKVYEKNIKRCGKIGD